MFVYKQFCFHVGVYYNGLAVLSIIPTASCSTHYWPAIYHLMGVCGRRNPGSSLFLSIDSASCRKSKTQTALLALFLRAFAKADAGSAAVLNHSTRSSLFYRSLHDHYGCLKRRKFILDNFPNHFVRNGVIFVPKHVPNAGDAAPTDRKSTRLNSSHRCISYAV